MSTRCDGVQPLNVSSDLCLRSLQSKLVGNFQFGFFSFQFLLSIFLFFLFHFFTVVFVTFWFFMKIMVRTHLTAFAINAISSLVSESVVGLFSCLVSVVQLRLKCIDTDLLIIKCCK